MAKSFARDERVALTFVGDDSVDAQREMIARHGLEAYPFVNGPEVGQAFAVGKLPLRCCSMTRAWCCPRAWSTAANISKAW
jgi:hypothetical protein